MLKEYNITRHYDTKHAETFSQFKEKDWSRLECITIHCEKNMAGIQRLGWTNLKSMSRNFKIETCISFTV